MKFSKELEKGKKKTFLSIWWINIFCSAPELYVLYNSQSTVTNAWRKSFPDFDRYNDVKLQEKVIITGCKTGPPFTLHQGVHFWHVIALGVVSCSQNIVFILLWKKLFTERLWLGYVLRMGVINYFAGISFPKGICRQSRFFFFYCPSIQRFERNVHKINKKSSPKKYKSTKDVKNPCL